MPPGADGGGAPELPPDDAFAVLGNETRVQILRTLGEADGPLSFTELRNRVGVRQGGQFNYHLEKVVGHFVAKTDEGYLLRQPGRRVVQAVLSGAVTADPRLELTEIDEACWWCGASIAVRYDQERLDLYCTGCEGTYGDTEFRRPGPVTVHEPTDSADLGYLGALFLPAAGFEHRTPAEGYRAAWTKEMLDYLAVSRDLCPRCSGTVETSVSVCDRHEAADGLCEACGNRKAVNLHVRCDSCIYRSQVVVIYAFFSHPDVVAFLSSHGVSPVPEGSELSPALAPYEEEIISTDPFEAHFTLSIGEETLTVTVDDDLEVVETARP